MAAASLRLGPGVRRVIGSSTVLWKRHVGTATTLPTAVRERCYPKLGNREIVGYGWNGDPTYIDRNEFPCPAVRFRENTPEILALREKEKGDWNRLTIEDKKAIYRASFRQTFAEMNAPTGEWKSIISIVLLGSALTCLFCVYLHLYVMSPLPETITKEWQVAQLELMIKQRQGHVEGVSSRWDYENNRWK
jgi:cytochrome c oxidase subunit 4